MTLQGPIRRKVYGPFESIQEVAGEGRIYLSLPYTEVMGSQVILSVKDNWAKFTAATNLGMYWPTLELTIWGAVQGLETVIKRQQTRMQTGPMYYIFDFAEAYDQVNFRARNVSGGRRGPPPDAEDPTIPDKRNGFSLTVDVHIQPRGGFATPENEAKAQRHAKKIRMG